MSGCQGLGVEIEDSLMGHRELLSVMDVINILITVVVTQLYKFLKT